LATNVTVRDFENFPGGTAKTITLDITQVVPVLGDPLEGDEIWITSAATTATASGGAAIQNIFKNQMKRGFAESSGLVTGPFTIPATAKIKVAIDEATGLTAGVDIEVDAGSNRLAEDIAQDIEAKIKAEAELGAGGAKIGNLSYLNVQVRFTNNKFSIESGTAGTSFTGTNKSSVKIGAPDTADNLRSILGFDVVTDSETLASRVFIETSVTVDYTSGDLLTVGSTTGLTAGTPFIITDGTNSSTALVSGTESASVLRFTTSSGGGLGLDATFLASGTLVRKLFETNTVEPVSAIKTVDQLYRFSIDSIVNQIDFSS